ncbi:NifB/NifX family molybdenum-iron cluster-binding protein [Synergistes jonesii]|uniref:NifB/NifX family molybdenum-iron cluster-binding protein n=1 Tax=Synergistes jonesii TaxID=2754 RepID=UPI00191C558B|nr:NifB/NifX family molybdenum-iron cluster-binding protein [Synergistes jonesii]
MPNPEHKPGFLPNFLGDMGVEVIIAGGMDDGAVEIFNERNIEVIVGAQGDAKVAVESYLRGDLKSTDPSVTSMSTRMSAEKNKRYRVFEAAL